MKKKVNIFKIVLAVFLCIACVSTLGLLLKPNSQTKQPANENISSVNFSNLTYVAFGDSITYGADYSNGYAQMANPYPKLVGQHLGLKSVVNKAVSGATLVETPDLSHILAKITSYSGSADIISVMGGVNDYARLNPLGKITDTTISTIYGSLNYIADYLTTKYPNSFIFFMTPYKMARYYEPGYQLYDVANAVKEVGNKYNIPVLDMYNYGNYELEYTDSDSDGIHPNQDFVITYTAPQIVNFIRDNI